MEPLLRRVRQDVHELVHQTQPALIEIDPPGFHWEWHLPLGFVSLAAAGTLLVAAAGVQQRVQEQRHSARKATTHMHKHKVRASPIRG